MANTGDNDASPDNAASQFLLLRGLEPSVTEELLTKGVAKLYKPASTSAALQSASTKKGAKVASTTGDANLGAKEGTLRRILLVRDRRTNESWRYGFAEFATVEDAQAALLRYNSFEKFTISSKPVLVSYIHAGVFVPVLNPTASTERFTFSSLSNHHVKLAYWDEDAYVTELIVSLPDADNNSEKPKSESALAAAAAEGEGLVKTARDVEKAKKRKAESAATGATKKAAPSHLQFWSNRHAELHGLERKPLDEDPRLGENGSNNRKPRNKSDTSASPPPSQSYADLGRKCCYLCSRQFKTEAEVNKHERLSQLHRDNLKKPELVTRAQHKLDKHQPSTEYRDRARERRQAFGVQKKSSTAQPETKETDEASAAPSKGASLLGKMGWSAGSGLGASGSGMTIPIATEVYAQGVGLGASGGKLGDAVEEAERQTKGDYSDFLQKTKDQARQRYEQL